MLLSFCLLLFLGTGTATQAPPQPVAAPPASFDVATIRAVDPAPRSSRILTMQGPRRFVAHNFTVRLLMAAAYNVNPKAITGGPPWIDTAKFDIDAVTPGEAQPTRKQQMAMLSALLADRFQLTFQREPKTFAIYALSVAKGGPKLKDSGKSDTDPSSVVSTVYPDHVLMPARNASMADFTALLQRAVLDRPVVDRTGLTGRYDFDLNWAPSEREFGGELPTPPADASSPPFVTALQEQLGLRIDATRGLAEALVVTRVSRPTEN